MTFIALLPILFDANPNLNLSLENEKVRAPKEVPNTMWIELDDPSFRAAHPDLGDEEWGACCALLDSYDALVRSARRSDNAAYGAAASGCNERVGAISQSARHLRAILVSHGIEAGLR